MFVIWYLSIKSQTFKQIKHTFSNPPPFTKRGTNPLLTVYIILYRVDYLCATILRFSQTKMPRLFDFTAIRFFANNHLIQYVFNFRYEYFTLFTKPMKYLASSRYFWNHFCFCNPNFLSISTAHLLLAQSQKAYT